MTTPISYRIYDKNGDLQKVLDHVASASWDYNRKGGCGQASLTIMTEDDALEHSLYPGVSLEILVDGEVRYAGKAIRFVRSVQSGGESLTVVFYGFLIDLSTLIVKKSYTGQGIKTIIQDILDTYVLPYSRITYTAADIEDPGYSVSQVDFNHTVRDAIVLLANLAGDIEWGVDRNKKFFFKGTDTNIRNVYVLGREVTSMAEERQDDQIINRLYVFGGAGLELTIQSAMSVDIFGRREANLFEGSLTVQADAFRLARSSIKNTASYKRSARFAFTAPDVFVEETTPLGAVAVTESPIRLLKKYSDFKYGRSNQYGNLKRDQFSTIQYQIAGGGMTVSAAVQSDIPNLGDLQKRFEFEIREVQRR